MTVDDELEANCAAMVMINPAPYNAEAPPAAPAGEVTPIEFHYVRSNFAVPDHDGSLELGGAVGKPRSWRSIACAQCLPTTARSPSSAPANGRLEMRPLPDRGALGRLRRLQGLRR